MIQNNRFTEQTFKLLAELEANNTKDWYNDNRDAFKAACLDPFEAVLGFISNRLAGEDTPLEGSAQTMFRMHRDVRFSKDKRPYKTSVSGMLTRTGTKADMDGMVFLQLDSTGGWAAGGFYRLPTPKLTALRKRIIAKDDQFATILDDLAATGRGLGDMERLKRMPRGFTEFEDHPHAEHIKLKSFVVRTELSKKDWLEGNVPEKVADHVRAVGPFLAFGTAALA